MAKSWYYRTREAITADPAQVFGWFTSPQRWATMRDRSVPASATDLVWDRSSEKGATVIKAAWTLGEGMETSELTLNAVSDAATLTQKVEISQLRRYMSGIGDSIHTQSVYEFLPNGAGGTEIAFSSVVTWRDRPSWNPMYRSTYGRRRRRGFHELVQACRAVLEGRDTQPPSYL